MHSYSPQRQRPRKVLPSQSLQQCVRPGTQVPPLQPQPGLPPPPPPPWSVGGPLLSRPLLHVLQPTGTTPPSPFSSALGLASLGATGSFPSKLILAGGGVDCACAPP